MNRLTNQNSLKLNQIYKSIQFCDSRTLILWISVEWNWKISWKWELLSIYKFMIYLTCQIVPTLGCATAYPLEDELFSIFLLQNISVFPRWYPRDFNLYFSTSAFTLELSLLHFICYFDTLTECRNVGSYSLSVKT